MSDNVTKYAVFECAKCGRRVQVYGSFRSIMITCLRCGIAHGIDDIIREPSKS